VVAFTDTKGKVVQKFVFDSFGNLRAGGAHKIKQPYSFTGREYDRETRLYYYRARYYDPGVGRFLQKDPASGISANPQAANPYPYTQNNPVNLTDPSGLWVIGRGVNIGVGLGLGVSGQALLLIDNHGNQGIAFGGTFGLTASVADLTGVEIIAPANNATINDLAGSGGCFTNLGGGFGFVGATIGAFQTSSCGGPFEGITIQAGLMVPLTSVAVSVGRSATSVISISDFAWYLLGRFSPLGGSIQGLNSARAEGAVHGISMNQVSNLLQQANQFIGGLSPVGAK